MNRVKETGIHFCLVAVFGISILSSALWMTGDFYQETVGLSNLQQLIPLEKKVKFQLDQQDAYQAEPVNTHKSALEARNDDSKSINVEYSHEPTNVQNNHKVEDIEQIEQIEQIVSNEKDITKKESITVSSIKRSENLDISYDLPAIEADLDFTQFEVQNVLATGYTAGYESTGKNPDHPEFGITYSGVKVRRDLYSTIAADINVFPIGTILYIPNYGYGVVADIGGAIKGNRIDLYFETVDDVYRLWGKQNTEVFVIKKGNGKLSETILDQLNHNEAVQVYKPKK